MDYSAENIWIFAGMIFVAVFLLAQSFITPAFGENRQVRRRMARRLQALSEGEGTTDAQAQLRRKAQDRSGWLYRIRGISKLETVLEQAGYRTPLPRLMGYWSVGVMTGAIAGYRFGGLGGLGMGAAAVIATISMKIQADRNGRIARFDEQLQDALGVMIRALRAGHPFSESIRLVGEEMPAPIGPEFGRIFSEINYGGDLRRALLGLLARVPSVTVMAMITAVMVQRETGGNLAETLEKIASVIRGRFRFQRKVRTLSAEARLSSWILTLIPFLLFIALSILNPTYLPRLTGNAVGQKLIMAAFGLVMVGVFWMRRIIRIKV